MRKNDDASKHSGLGDGDAAPAAPPAGAPAPRSLIPESALITALLNRWASGDPEALNTVLPQVYAELRKLAHNYVRRERPDHTLQPTALVNESIARLLGGKHPAQWQSRAQLIGIMARTMREVLVDAARRHNAIKRPNPANQVHLDQVEIASEEASIVGLDNALRRLAQVHPRQARVVEFKYFGGLSLSEIAGLLEVSEATITRDWRLARAWLRRDLGSDRDADSDNDDA